MLGSFLSQEVSMNDTSPETRDILVITADAVKETGIISFKFMIDADPGRKLHLMPQLFGYVWRTDNDSYSFNIFEGGKGLAVGGGFGPSNIPEWEKRIIDAIPSCTLLMDIDLLPWWQELAKRNDLVFRHHHFTGILKTS